MNVLDRDWITKGLIDFEYKKYVLLAYLKRVKKGFDHCRLYPHLEELLFHYQNLMMIKENQNLIYESFPKQISKADFEKLKITYKTIVEDSDMMQEINDIVSFAIPQMQSTIRMGKEIYQNVEEEITIEPVGVFPLYLKEGYWLVSDTAKEVKVYHFTITVFERADENYRGLHTHFVRSEWQSISNTYEQMKLNLIKDNKELTHPATYLIATAKPYPYEETLMPVAKRLFLRYLKAA